MIFKTPELRPDEESAIRRINELRIQLKYATSTPKRWTGLLRRDAFARAIRGSNTIEGYNVTIDDAVAVAENEEPLDANEETRAAIIGYRDALTYILQLENDPHFEYNASLIRSLHYMMIKYDLSKHPGQWRPGPIRVVDERKKEVVYTGPDADKVPGLMLELVNFLNEKNSAPVIIRAAMAHLNLTMIHPFSDGNGRMARALQTLVLAREGILSPTFCSIEEYLGRHQDDYYNVLADVGKGTWHPEHDARPWVRFCLLAHYRGATNLLRRTREFQILWDEIELQRKKHDLPERVEVAMVTAAFGRRVYNSIYRKMAEISDQIASRDLKKLTDLGLLVPQGEKRGRIYVGSKKLLAARERLKEIRIEDDPFSGDKPRQPSLPGLSAS